MNSQMTDLALQAKCEAFAPSGLITCAAPADCESSDESASNPNPDPLRRRKSLRETLGRAKKCRDSFDINKLVQTQQRLAEIFESEITRIRPTIRVPLLFQKPHRFLQFVV